VEQGGDQQQVRPVDPSSPGGGVQDGLDQMPVHSEAVQRVALRPVADEPPLRQQPGQHSGLVEGLPHTDHARAGSEEGHEGVPGRGRPWFRKRRHHGVEAGDRHRLQREAALRGQRGRPHRQHRVVPERGTGRHDHLAVVLGEAGFQRHRAGQPPGRPAGAARRGQHPVHAAPGHVGRMRDGPGRPGDALQQGIGTGQLQAGGDRLLLLEHQPVAGPSGHRMQGIADVQQLGRRSVESPVRPVGHPGGGHGAECDDVAEPAAPRLQIRLQGVRDVPGALRPLGAQGAQLGQATPGRPPPVGEHRRAQVRRQAAVPGDEPQAEQSQEDRHVLARQPPGLDRGSYGVVQADAGVPHRVPQLLGDRHRVGVPVVQQDDVQVAAW
jgi:hypothetical protein